MAQAKPARIQSDLLVVGGNESACASAVQAARMGVKSITMVNDIGWLGGQFSAQGLVAIDENADGTGIRHTLPIPRSGLFEEVLDRIEAINRKKYGRARPGNTRVITTCRPADAERAFRDLLKPYVQRGQLHLRDWYAPVATRLENGTLQSVRFQSLRGNRPDLVIEAGMTIDASDRVQDQHGWHKRQ